MILDKLFTYYRLGLMNLVRVFVYKVKLKTGFALYKTPIADVLIGKLFDEDILNAISRVEMCRNMDSSATRNFSLTLFGWKTIDWENTPDWFISPLTGMEHKGSKLHWAKISDFSDDFGDIKDIWEISRMDWLVKFARQAIVTGDGSWISRLNQWISDWNEKNPANLGPNWKCGQETSIRVIHLVFTALLLNQHRDPSDLMLRLLEQHLCRVEQTFQYAIAQDNNHGTSEAAAFFIGGIFLWNATKNKRHLKWKEKGRFWLENRVHRLLEVDGTFSQYSVNYHRLMLDTLCVVEVLCREYGERAFSRQYYEKLGAATKWLMVMTDPDTGDAPNIGANDGAHIIPVSNTDYRDYRPTIQLASVLFLRTRVYASPGPYDFLLNLLEIPSVAAIVIPESKVFCKGGYAVLKTAETVATLRLPFFRFRPGHSDALHLDLFINGVNVFRDGGSYSYNSDERWLGYFPGTEAHNTIQFDGRDQMPRISRFLYGRWLNGQSEKAFQVNKDHISYSAFYADSEGAYHKRIVTVSPKKMVVVDTVSGFVKKAVLRWRLCQGDWAQNGCIIENENIQIKISAQDMIDNSEITEGWEARYYGKKTVLPVIETTVPKETTLTTEVTWV